MQARWLGPGKAQLTSRNGQSRVHQPSWGKCSLARSDLVSILFHNLRIIIKSSKSLSVLFWFLRTVQLKSSSSKLSESGHVVGFRIFCSFCCVFLRGGVCLGHWSLSACLALFLRHWSQASSWSGWNFSASWKTQWSRQACSPDRPRSQEGLAGDAHARRGRGGAEWPAQSPEKGLANKPFSVSVWEVAAYKNAYLAENKKVQL